MDQYVLAYQYIPIRTGKTTNDFQRNDSLFRRLHRVGLRERERETHRLRPRGMGITTWSTRMGRLGIMNTVSPKLACVKLLIYTAAFKGPYILNSTSTERIPLPERRTYSARG